MLSPSKLLTYTLGVLFQVQWLLAGSLFPGALWTDTTGLPIQAHGGGFLLHNGFYYWFGEDKTENSHQFQNVNCYRSSDLITWQFQSHALTSTPGTAIDPEAVVERPKVIYNAKSEQFVMWFHLDSSDYGLAQLGVAISSRVEGPYFFIQGIAPFDEDSRDMTVWVDQDDPNKTAYLVYATRVNLDTVIARLSDTYLEIEQRLIMLEGIHREAYAVFKTNGLYYIIMSRATGWDSNPNEYMFSTSMSGPWSERREIAPDSSNTFDSQANYVIPLNNGNFVYCGDRWNRYSLDDSRYVWLPIVFGADNTISISWKGQWSVDTKTGMMTNATSTQLDENASETEIIGTAKVVSCSGCVGGTSIGYIGLGGSVRFQNLLASNGKTTYSILIAYANGDSSPRYLTVDINGIYGRNLVLPSTGSGQTTKEIVFNVEFVQGSANYVTFYNDFAYGPDLDFIKVEQ